MDQKLLADMMDVSVLKPDNNENDVKEMVAFAKEKRCIAVFSLPAYTPDVVKYLDGDTSIQVGGVAGFPSGSEMTSIKIAQTKELITAGATEIDMVINVGKVKIGNYGYVLDEIKSIIDAADGAPVKSIFECHYLTDDEILRLSEIGCEAGVSYIKTGTGWAPTGATPENVTLMKSVVGDRVRIKAAGGIRDLATLEEIHRCGAVRFGIGLGSAREIFNELANRQK
jgi:deoxyribose-phosphate aldolase